MVFWSLSCYKELKLTTNPFTGHTLHGLLMQMQNISLRSLGMRRGLKVTQLSSLLLFPFSPPLFFRFSCSFFFSLAGHLVGFILMGRVFKKAFRILGLGVRKGRWEMEQDFHENLQVNLAWVFCRFLRCP